jgi:hypothetical protein
MGLPRHLTVRSSGERSESTFCYALLPDVEPRRIEASDEDTRKDQSGGVSVTSEGACQLPEEDLKEQKERRENEARIAKGLGREEPARDCTSDSANGNYDDRDTYATKSHEAILIYAAACVESTFARLTFGLSGERSESAGCRV